MKKLLLFLLPLLLLAACRQEGLPKGVLDEERMADFLAEAYLLEGFYAIETQYRYDVLTADALRRYDSILAAQNITRKEVEQSFAYYAEHLDVYQTIQDSVVARLEAQQTGSVAEQ